MGLQLSPSCYFMYFVNVCRDRSRYFLEVGVHFEIMDLKKMIFNAILLACLFFEGCLAILQNMYIMYLL